MSVLSTFYVGPSAEIARAIRERLGQVDSEFPSLDLSYGLSMPGGLVGDQIEAAYAALSRLRGGGPRRRPIGKVLEGGEESQVIRVAPDFVAAFSTLTEAEAEEVSRRLQEQEMEEERSEVERRRRLASRPLQSGLDLLALILVPLLVWARSRSVAWAAFVGIAFAILGLVVLPWWRRRKVPRVPTAPADHRPALLRMAEICRVASRSKQDLVYMWSL